MLSQKFKDVQVKPVTLICAIVFTVSAGLGLYNLSQNVMRFHLAPAVYLGQIVWVLGQCCLVAFFFTLYSRQQ